MQRPTMHPSFIDDEPLDEQPRHRPWRRAARVMRLLMGTAARLLLTRPFAFLTGHRDSPKKPWTFSRLASLILHRLAFAPLVLFLLVAALVYNATHPPSADTGLDPSAIDLYYDRISMVAQDGTRLDGWLFPLMDEKMILEKRDRIFAQRDPAVVLVHGQGQTPAQMLPLVQPLHEAGMIVLIVGLRGTGTGNSAAQTFGLNETMDVHAAVDMLRRRPFVDPQRISLVGQGSGATAAWLAAESSPINALVLDNPIQSVEQILPIIGPSHAWLSFLRPMCKWGFELAYQVNTDQLNLLIDHHFASRPNTLLLTDPSAQTFYTPAGRQQIANFLHDRLVTGQAPPVASLR
ncbi:MAG: hypothetical protein IT448_04035 [Phycisphaerales bacterium]|nr:hypothetical protein [Phycisphaerales bacterium]